jgi:hypothetical protein
MSPRPFGFFGNKHLAVLQTTQVNATRLNSVDGPL